MSARHLIFHNNCNNNDNYHYNIHFLHFNHRLFSRTERTDFTSAWSTTTIIRKYVIVAIISITSAFL